LPYQDGMTLWKQSLIICEVICTKGKRMMNGSLSHGMMTSGNGVLSLHMIIRKTVLMTTGYTDMNVLTLDSEQEK